MFQISVLSYEEPAVLGVLYSRPLDIEKPALSVLDHTEAMTRDDLAALLAPLGVS